MGVEETGVASEVNAEIVVGAAEEVPLKVALLKGRPRTPGSGGPTPRGQQTNPRSGRAESTGFLGRTLTGVRSREPAPGDNFSNQGNETLTSLKFLTYLLTV